MSDIGDRGESPEHWERRESNQPPSGDGQDTRYYPPQSPGEGWTNPYPVAGGPGWTSPYPPVPSDGASWGIPYEVHSDQAYAATAWAPPPAPPPRRRTAVVIVAAVVVFIVVLVAALNIARGHGSKTAQSGQQPTAVLPPAGPSSTPNGQGGGGSNGQGGTGQTPDTVPAVACPQIRDEQSHLAYRCIDNYLTQSAPDSNLGLRIALDHETEPGWVISEGSGNPSSLATPAPGVIAFRRPSAASPVTDGGTASPSVSPSASASPSTGPAPSLDAVKAEVRRRAALALQEAYGDNPSATLAGERTRAFSGVSGYQLQLDITINPQWRAAQGLHATSERLWVVGVPTKAGVSIFMLSIPNARSDLWPKADATIGTITVI